MSYPYDNAIVIVANIDGFSIKRILINNGCSYYILIWQAANSLLSDLAKLKKVKTPLV